MSLTLHSYNKSRLDVLQFLTWLNNFIISDSWMSIWSWYPYIKESLRIQSKLMICGISLVIRWIWCLYIFVSVLCSYLLTHHLHQMLWSWKDWKQSSANSISVLNFRSTWYKTEKKRIWMSGYMNIRIYNWNLAIQKSLNINTISMET